MDSFGPGGLTAVADVVHTLTSASGRLRIDVVRRPTGGFQLAYSRYAQEHVPGHGLVWEGWVPVPEGVTLTDTPERGAALAAEAMGYWELQEAEQLSRPADLNKNEDSATA
jgi:hypothetical protein